ncbi:head GIN domain-containing protein [Zhouia sp. PK063]|uniref:head GIN domain-containing protein n=1 Tax=Zhouia sp. PK063 TaxID=3373602 RepID=UPI00379AE420
MKYILTLAVILSVQLGFSQRIIDKNVGNFSTLKVYDLIAVNLIHSNENKVVIKGKNVDDIEVLNKNGKLKIRMRLEKSFHGEDTFVEVYYTNIDVIDANEGAKITVNELMKQNTLELRTQEGAKIKAGLNVNFAKVRAVTGGIIEVSGLAKSQEITLNTGGIFDGRDLKAKDAKVKITAAGEAELYASNSVDINVKAGGDVDVYGDPKKVEKKTFAGGRIKIH